MCWTNRRHREVCRVYEETIFAQKISNEFKLHNREQILTFVSGFATPVDGNDTTKRPRNTLGFARLKYVYEFLYYCRRDPKLLHGLTTGFDGWTALYWNADASQMLPLKFLIRLHKLIPIWIGLLGKSEDSQFWILSTAVRLRNERNDGPALTPQELGNLFCEWLTNIVSSGGPVPDRVIRLFVQEGSPDYSCRCPRTGGTPQTPLLNLLLRTMARNGKLEAFQREILASALSSNPRPNLNAFGGDFDTVVMVALQETSRMVVSDLLGSGLPINFSPFLVHFDQSRGLIHAAISSIADTEEDFSEIYKYIIKKTPDEGLTVSLFLPSCGVGTILTIRAKIL
ncbi:hypothetical protein HK102_004089 [Quaeritorhiza haematococci]|nr:hypothetical protein HK102_004089 [Quaeritorhiza haematococci]